MDLFTYAEHQTHPNSVEALRVNAVKFTGRKRRIMDVLEGADKPLTDRQIQAILNLPEKNNVSPRLTELINDGYAREVDDVICEVTKERVRRVAIRN